MDRITFAKHLAQATGAVIPFSRKYLNDRLPGEARYLIFPNQSYDGNPLVGDEQVYPGEGHDGGAEPCVAAEVVGRLYRAEKVPEWINVRVDAVEGRFTHLRLDCCGRYTAEDGRLYHRLEGYPPFHVLGPWLPPGWESAAAGGKFDLDWPTRRRANA